MLEAAAASSSPGVLYVLLSHGLYLDDTDALPAAAGVFEAPPGLMAPLLDLGMDIKMQSSNEDNQALGVQEREHRSTVPCM